MNIKSKSSMTFKEFKQKINEYQQFENEWGFYFDIESNKMFLIKNDGKNEESFYSIIFNKYTILICFGIFILIII